MATTKKAPKTAAKSSKAASSKSKPAKKDPAPAKAAVKSFNENSDWTKDGKHWADDKQILIGKREEFEAGKLDGYTYNTFVRPLIERFEGGERSEHLHIKTQKLAEGVFEG